MVTTPTSKIHAHSLITAPDGGLDWGRITPEIESATGGRVLAGPIRVCHGRHDGPNRGYGKIHIEAEHSKEFICTGFARFVVEAISSFDAIYQQHDKVIATMRHGHSRIVAVLEWRNPGFYSVVTAFRPTPTKAIAGEVIWKKPQLG